MRPFIVSLFFICFSLSLLAQSNLYYYLPQNIGYNNRVPTPADILGFEVGEWHATHEQIRYYLKTLAASSDRIEIEEMGQSHEARPLYILRVTAASNQKQIEEIKSQHQALSDPDRNTPADPDQQKLVVWLGYTIHGNEASGSNASMLLAYYLAAAQSPAVERLLDKCVVIIDPCMNPDGMNRFATWVNSHKSQQSVTDPASREFVEAWPGGRTNHYWFDLNRDWLPAQHPESQARLEKFYEWRPNVFTDHHEMGKHRTFFFQPGIPSRNNPLTPRKVYDLTNQLAGFHAKALDQIGTFYYSAEGYDDYYIGKGATYPDLHGSVGILFEQASARGYAQETENGVLSLAHGIRNQFSVSLSTLEGSMTASADLLGLQRDFYTSAMTEARNDAEKAYVVDFRGKNYVGQQLWEMTQRHQIKSYLLQEDIQVNGHPFQAGKSLVFPLEQAEYRYLKALFERRTQFQDSLFYDVSSWTMPLAFGLKDAVLDARSWSNRMIGEEWKQFPAAPTAIPVGQSG